MTQSSVLLAMRDKPDPPHPLPLRIIYAIGRGFAHLFRLRWYGGGPGAAEKCRKCNGNGVVNLTDGLPTNPLVDANASPCRFCGGIGHVYKTDGVT